MRNTFVVLELTAAETRLIRESLIWWRNALLRQNCAVDAIDDLLLMLTA